MNLLTRREPLIVTAPDSSKHSASVIVLHGLGGSGERMAGAASLLANGLRHARFILPHATACTLPSWTKEPVRLPGWFDLGSDFQGGGSRSESLMNSVKHINELVAQESALGIKPERIAVVGVSQGGALALFMLRASQSRLAGVAGLCTWLPLSNERPLLNPANRATPVLMGHGTSDNVVLHQFGQNSYEVLRGQGAHIQFKSYPGMPHTPSEKAQMDVQQFLKEVLPTSDL